MNISRYIKIVTIKNMDIDNSHTKTVHQGLKEILIHFN